ncbi:unnamed protein product [Effrenium voratum]|nr:unnamed protein product [Effrenium voratum]
MLAACPAAPLKLVEYNHRINSCKNGGHWQQALHLLYLLPEKKLQSNGITYCNVIGACARRGQWQRALLVFQEAILIELDIFIANATISACEKAAQWQLALELLAQVHTTRLQADAA